MEKKNWNPITNGIVETLKKNGKETLFQPFGMEKKIIEEVGTIGSKKISEIIENSKKQKTQNQLTVDLFQEAHESEKRYIILKRYKNLEDSIIGERKLYRGLLVNILDFRKDVLRLITHPSGISSQVGILYISHPLNPEIYIPSNQYFDIILKEQIDEIKVSLMQLGARYFKIEYKESLVQDKQYKARIGIKMPVSDFVASRKTSSETSVRSEYLLQDAVEYTANDEFLTVKEPILFWNKNDIIWNELIEKRKKGESFVFNHHYEYTKDTSFSFLKNDSANIDYAVSKLGSIVSAEQSFSSMLNQQMKRSLWYQCEF